MTKQQDAREKALAAQDKKALYGADVDFAHYPDKEGAPLGTVELAALPEKQRRTLAAVGIETDGAERSATYMQLDHEVVHCEVNDDGLELMGTQEAAKRYPELVEKYWWRAMAPDADKSKLMDAQGIELSGPGMTQELQVAQSHSPADTQPAPAHTV